MSWGSKKSKTDSKFENQSDPWDEATPYLKDWLSQLGQTSTMTAPGMTADQSQAFETLKTNAQQGNPNAGAIAQLATDQLSAPDNSGMVKDAYSDLTRRTSATADGKNLDLGNNEYLQKMLTQVGDDAQNRVNASFAAAGRDFSGANQQAVGRGVTQAQAPLLLDFFNKEQGRTDAAARDLFSGANQTAGQMTALEAQRNAIRTQGIETTKAGMEARDAAPNTMLSLSQQMKDLPIQDLAQLAQLLFPAAQLGSQSSGTGTQTTKSTSVGVNLSDIGKIASGMGTLICDARVKRDIEHIATAPDGLRLYRFRYLDDDALHMGPMAQEVAALYPDAVVASPEGLLMVDVDKATRGAADLMGAQYGIAG